MPFVPDDEVHVAALGAGVVREVRNGGRYLVEVKGRRLVVDEATLTRLAQRKRRGLVAETAAARPRDRTDARPMRSATLDLHGLTTVEAIAAVDTFLNDAILSGDAEVRVIHGRSGGRLKSALHQHLHALPVVRAFRIDPSNPGVTIVSLM